MRKSAPACSRPPAVIEALKHSKKLFHIRVLGDLRNITTLYVTLNFAWLDSSSPIVRVGSRDQGCVKLGSVPGTLGLDFHLHNCRLLNRVGGSSRLIFGIASASISAVQRPSRPRPRATRSPSRPLRACRHAHVARGSLVLKLTLNLTNHFVWMFKTAIVPTYNCGDRYWR